MRPGTGPFPGTASLHYIRASAGYRWSFRLLTPFFGDLTDERTGGDDLLQQGGLRFLFGVLGQLVQAAFDADQGFQELVLRLVADPESDRLAGQHLFGIFGEALAG